MFAAPLQWFAALLLFSVCITKNLGVSGKVQQRIVGTVTVAPVFDGKMLVPPMGEDSPTYFILLRFRRFFFVCSTTTMVQDGY
jgi:hypothetical protein